MCSTVFPCFIAEPILNLTGIFDPPHKHSWHNTLEEEDDGDTCSNLRILVFSQYFLFMIRYSWSFSWTSLQGKPLIASFINLKLNKLERILTCSITSSNESQALNFLLRSYSSRRVLILLRSCLRRCASKSFIISAKDSFSSCKLVDAVVPSCWVPLAHSWADCTKIQHIVMY